MPSILGKSKLSTQVRARGMLLGDRDSFLFSEGLQLENNLPETGQLMPDLTVSSSNTIIFAR